ncbi:protodermal factor 1-like isoform X1 [Primulina eburnea]|uniref:protodermal factor 1-like isoform X1 n=1 Tax=Primulina eburnea TaxID=1245227 RepID=UPI003C6C69B7
MEKKRSVQAASVLLILSVMLSQNLVLSAANYFEEQKNFFNFPPSVYTPPSQGSGSGSYPCPTPSKGGSYTPTPSKGGSYKSPTPSKGGSYKSPTPSKGGSYGKPPSKGYSSSPVYHAPPVSTPTPVHKTPPSSLQNPPYSCIYWKTHPGLISAVFGWWGTVGSAFNTPTIPGFSPSTSLLQALSNTRTDGYGDLYREGTAALLNSMAHSASYPYSAAQVKDGFTAALSSNHAAAVQAKLYKMANEARVN